LADAIQSDHENVQLKGTSGKNRMPGVDRCDQAVQVDLQLDNNSSLGQTEPIAEDESSGTLKLRKNNLEDTADTIVSCGSHGEDFLNSLLRKRGASQRGTCKCGPERYFKYFY
jgi:hypothetical protein